MWGALLIAGISFFAGLFGTKAKARETRKLAEREMFLEIAHEKSLAETDLAAIKEQVKLNKSKTAMFEAAQFQKGTHGGPYFQVIK